MQALDSRSGASDVCSIFGIYNQKGPVRERVTASNTIIMVFLIFMILQVLTWDLLWSAIVICKWWTKKYDVYI